MLAPMSPRFPLLLLLVACGPTRPSFLLITLDTTRADHLGPYGYPAAATPSYDRFAEQGTIWTRAYSSAPLTIVSHSTILTGRAPPGHGVRDNGDFVLGPEQVTLAERFHAAGWHTSAFTSAFPTQARWGFDQGFDDYHDPLRRLPTELDWRDERSADQVVDDAIQTLGAVPDDAPLFVWVHLFDAHWPYRPPEPYATRFRQSPYDGEIAFASDQVGRLVEFWDRARPDNAVLITADHGEGLGDGGERTHGFLLHDGTLHIPLMARGHGALAAAFQAGARVEDPVSHIDIAPTLLNLAGIALDDELQGRDLREGGSGRIWSEALTPLYNLGLAPLYAITEPAGRYTRGGYSAFYPASGGVVSVVPDSSADLPAWQQKLDALRATLGDATAPSASLNPDAVAQLQALGYMGGDPNAVASDVDPRDVIDVIPLTWEIHQVMGRRPDRAEAMLGTLERRMPGAWGVELLRAQLARSQGKIGEAVERLTSLYQRSPSATLALQVADLWRALADPQEAGRWYREALDMEPTSPEAMLGSVLCARMLGDDAGAEIEAEADLRTFPDHAQLVLLRAEMLMEDGRNAEAADEARWALERMPRDPLAWLVTAEARWELGDADEAIALLQEALELDRTDLEVRLTLVDHLLEVGRRAEARRALLPAWRLEPDDPRVFDLGQELGMGG